MKLNSNQSIDTIPHAFLELQFGSQHYWSMPQAHVLATEVRPNHIQRGAIQ